MPRDRRLIAAFDPENGALAVVPVIDGGAATRCCGAAVFPRLMAIEGDVGARKLIGAHGEAVVEVAGDRQGRAGRRRHAGRAREAQVGALTAPAGAPAARHRSEQ